MEFSAFNDGQVAPSSEVLEIVGQVFEDQFKLGPASRNPSAIECSIQLGDSSTANCFTSQA